MKRTNEALVSLIRQARGNKDYNSLEDHHSAFLSQAGGKTEPVILKQWAVVHYELGRAQYERWVDFPDHPPEFLRVALMYYRQSAAEGDAAGDIPARFLAYQEIGGHIKPAMGEWQDGLDDLRYTIKRAWETLPSASKEDSERIRRALMNCYLLAIENTSQYCDDGEVGRGEVENWLTEVQHNSVFADECAKDPKWGQKYIDMARAYITRP